MDRSIIINPGAATEDAVQIESIVASMTEDMQVLNQVINSKIPNEVNTAWATELQSNWKKYYSAEIPAAMEDMKLSAANLKVAVEAAIRFSQGQ
ncbi:MAG: hypothetical protein IJ097_00380 [Bacilli bacterium]|nr:hypothetical protein [Bacilli bacterium]